MTPWRRQWHPIPVLLPGKSHGQRSLVGCSPWGCTESDTTEQLHSHFSLFTFMRQRRKWQPIPVSLPGESQRWGSLVGCHLWGHTESDTIEVIQQQQQIFQHTYQVILYSFFPLMILTCGPSMDQTLLAIFAFDYWSIFPISFGISKDINLPKFIFTF